MSDSPRTRLNAVVADQHQHFATAQAVACGVSPRVVARMHRTGETTRVHRGVHRMASAPVTWRGRLMAAVLAAAPPITAPRSVRPQDGAVASHGWAAKLHGIERIDTPDSPEVTITVPHALEIPDVRVHRTRRLERCDITTVDGIPVTSGARMAVDLAAGLDEANVMALADDLICLHATTRPWLHTRATALCAGRRHVDVLVRITAPEAEGEFWSWLERTFDQTVVRAFDLPPPAYNVPLHDRRGRIGIADACWAGAVTVVVELDGLRFHQLTSQRGNDQRKHNRYATAGYVPLRFGYRDVVREPDRVAAVIAEALAGAGPQTAASAR